MQQQCNSNATVMEQQCNSSATAMNSNATATQQQRNSNATATHQQCISNATQQGTLMNKQKGKWQTWIRLLYNSLLAQFSLHVVIANTWSFVLENTWRFLTGIWNAWNSCAWKISDSLRTGIFFQQDTGLCGLAPWQNRTDIITSGACCSPSSSHLHHAYWQMVERCMFALHQKTSGAFLAARCKNKCSHSGCFKQYQRLHHK